MQFAGSAGKRPDGFYGCSPQRAAEPPGSAAVDQDLAVRCPSVRPEADRGQGKTRPSKQLYLGPAQVHNHFRGWHRWARPDPSRRLSWVLSLQPTARLAHRTTFRSSTCMPISGTFGLDGRQPRPASRPTRMSLWLLWLSTIHGLAISDLAPSPSLLTRSQKVEREMPSAAAARRRLLPLRRSAQTNTSVWICSKDLLRRGSKVAVEQRRRRGPCQVDRC
jgi:hypothetical protein